MTETLHNIPAKVRDGDFDISLIDLIRDLRITDLQSIFIMTIIGYVIAMFGFVCELLYYNLYERRDKYHLTKEKGNYSEIFPTMPRRQSRNCNRISHAILKRSIKVN